MKHTEILTFAGAALCAMLAFAGCQPADNTLTSQEKAAGWQLLFDGKTMEGWRDYMGEELTGPWTVVDGAIEAEGEGNEFAGYIVYDQPFENFELQWDWKISKGGNSGMIYHVMEGPEFKYPFVTGPEYQLIDDENFSEMNDGYELLDWQRCAVDYAMYQPDFEARNMKPAGEWNTSKIIFDNGHVTYYLNGKITVEFDAWTPDWFARKNSGKWENCPEYGMARKGLICLQDHGYPAWFKNLKIKELPAKPEKVSLFNGKDLSGWKVCGTEKWYVENGELVCESGEDKAYGYLCTEKYYDDFDLTLEFKQESDGNSGVFVRSFVPEGVRVCGWQVEVAPFNCDTGGVYESYGRGWLYQIPDEKENVLEYGEWNTMRIRLEGGHLQSWLNGVAMTDLEDEKIGAAQGRICLQIHDGGGIKVRWRNLELQEL